MNSADRIDQLNALRFKMQSGNKNSPWGKKRGNFENEMPGMVKEIQKAETYNKYGDAARKIEIDAIGKHGASA